jgi:protein involved in polysaccharide export with SLBB domain
MKIRLSFLIITIITALLIASTCGTWANPLSQFGQSILSSPRGATGRGGASENSLGDEQKPLQEGPVDPRVYLLGPGDVLGVDVWGAASIGFLLKVDAEGKVLIPDSGPLAVAGMSLEDARDLIKSTVLSAVRQGKVDVRLVTLRAFKVHVSGEVERPGTYIASAATRVSELLGNPGTLADLAWPGLRDGSSLRNIQLKRLNGQTLRADLASFFVSGDVSGNPFLSDGDVIYVPRAERHFSVSGGVMFPGTYELVEGEKLSQVLQLVGGVTPEADPENGEISRFVDLERSEFVHFRLASVLNGETDFDIKDGDGVFVRTPPHYLERHRVHVGGEVVFPGWYAINRREDTLSGLIARAGGLTQQADLSSARVIRPDSLPSGELARVKTDFVGLLAKGDKKDDILLESGDLIEIPRRVDYVLVSGEVRKPGYVRYVPDKGTGFYVREAGGFTGKASSRKTLVKRFSTGQSLGSREAGSVRPNDEVFVPTRPEGARWTLIKDTVILLAQVATIYIVIHQATTQ